VVALVPDHEGVLAAQVVQALGAVVLVQVERDLAVGLGPEPVPAVLQCPADALEVVELAVHHDVDGLILVGDRLVAGHEIDDREPGVTEGDPAVGGHPVAAPVGAAVVERRHACAHGLGGNWGLARENRGDTAHGTTRVRGGVAVVPA